MGTAHRAPWEEAGYSGHFGRLRDLLTGGWERAHGHTGGGFFTNSGVVYPEDLPGPGMEPVSLMSPALAVRFFTTAPPGRLLGGNMSLPPSPQSQVTGS